MTATQNKVIPEVQTFLNTPIPLFINGDWHTPKDKATFIAENPATGNSLATVYEAKENEVNMAVDAAERAFHDSEWSRMSAYDRSKLMFRLADLMERDFEIIAQLDSLDNGKPVDEVRESDLPNAIENLRYFAGWTTKLTGQTIPIDTEFFNYTRHEPVGVVGQIIPWNFPIMMGLWKIAPAIATGCTVVLKPAEQTPVSALYLGKLIKESGFPDGVINIISGFGKEAGHYLVNHQKVNKIAFTGSTATGQQIMKQAADTMKRVTLELGGKSPNIILEDADLEKAVPGVFNGIMVNQGEVCCAGSRVFIPEKIFDQVVQKLKSFADNTVLGMGIEEGTTMGPLVSQKQYDTVTAYIEKGLNEGATMVTGGTKDGEGYFVKPTIFTDVNKEMSIVKEEIFGPVAVLIPYSEIDEVVDMANDTEYGLAAGVWTQNLKNAHTVANKLKAGTVWINCYNLTNAATPFGGYKQSGFGREMGSYALENYTEVKSVWVNLD
ncbi:aldehyde dehydrogenase family protein [Staphylococcus sp. KG4-3]|uniref:aldehyde dehydrogenase family protein n=1 Tax=Staphylococcus sp. KG4-3 TaxID=3093634 RepID=UPI00298F3B3F|nr:aldehyde dehydrogenase family protein [Staphylococcus sp. KG4-3]MDW8543454.1 aldehyde dehydrogenase family protein [Staphylococcus sp. KG4-1]MDW8562877.1 aldehyde dehydrogenase family protein [Staphylococcus sp. KG4-3]